MILVIGGAFQGKTAFVEEQFYLSDADIFRIPLLSSKEYPNQGTDFSLESYQEMKEAVLSAKAIANYEEWIRWQMAAGEDLEAFWKRFLEEQKDAIVIAREIGQGIVPLEKELRLFREQAGRMLCEIAKEAEEVWRVYCQIPMKIKG